MAKRFWNLAKPELTNTLARSLLWHQRMLATVGQNIRSADWDFEQSYPASCTDCDDPADSNAIIRWRLDNDSTVRDAFCETDADLTNRFFLELLADPAGFRKLVVNSHGAINTAHPKRYKRFIVAGDTTHTALQSPLFYSQTANGVFYNEWAGSSNSAYQ